ncbi:MAG: ImmA/IrrE family metallo-endopeptidase [Agitococcus sp.]|nr:ImmA/IrrE family metallo-endopeptidase [Agitococcus sp.]
MLIDRMELADITKPGPMAAAVLKQVREQNNGVLPIPIPIEEIAYGADISGISPIQTPGFQGALIITDGGSIGHILKNANSPITRQRYTVGHELGHWLLPLHSVKTKELYCTSVQMTRDFSKNLSPAERIEVEANMFAAEILLPDREFKNDLRPFGEPSLQALLALSEKFEVSKLATAKRYTTLNDHPCAVVTSKDCLVQHIFRGRDFPSLGLKVGYPLPPRSHSFTLKRTLKKCSEIVLARWENWLKDQPHATAELYEQVLHQADGYIMTLLYLNMDNCPDEDEEFIERSSIWNPTLR